MSSVDSLTIRRLKEGDESALRRVYDVHSKQAYQLVFRFLKDSAWTEEIVQDVFLKLWLKREMLDEHGNLWIYLYVIAKRLCLNKLRDIRKNTEQFEILVTNIELESVKIEDQLALNELEQHAGRIIDRLPKQQQVIFRLSREEGLSHNEIAQKLGLSSNTVKNHIVQALKTLKGELQKAGYMYLSVTVVAEMMAG